MAMNSPKFLFLTIDILGTLIIIKKLVLAKDYTFPIFKCDLHSFRDIIKILL